MDIRDLAKAAMALIGLALVTGQYPKLVRFARLEGTKALVWQDYEPRYFFGAQGRAQ